MANPSEKNKGYKAVLSIPNFRKLWIGQTISQTGDGLTNLALLIVINQLTGSPAALATMMVVIAIPQLVFGLFAGVYADRWDRKRIMIVSDLLRGLLVLGLVVVRRPEDIWIFYVLGFMQAVVGTFFDPAKSAMIPTIVDHDSLLAANALTQTTRVITNVVGSALAGLLVGLLDGAWPAFTLDCLSFLVSALFISRIDAPTHIAQVAGNARQTFKQLVDGLRYLAGNRILVGIMTTFAVSMLGLGAVNVLIVPFLTNNLQVPTEALGAIDAAQVIGMVLGSTLVAVLANRLKTVQMIAGGVALLGVFIAAFGAAPIVWAALVSLFFVGLALTPVQAAAAALLQGTVPDEKLGRASSAMNTVIALASVISMSVAGLLGNALGVRQVFYLSGAITILAGLLAAVLMRSPVRPAVSPVVSAEG